nr:MAG TPA: hypothetical protein [Bacteriophage sp.]
MLPFIGKDIGGYRIPNIKTGFWLKILLVNQRIIHEKSNSKLIDVIQKITHHRLYYIT